ncbi:MAG: DedA family protein [Thermoanaerobaculia bacterium]
MRPDKLRALYSSAPMEKYIENFLHQAADIPPLLLLGLLGAGSLLEYVFPPFPGDAWTVAGAVLIARGQSFWPVLLGVNLGALLGGALNYGLGIWLANPSRSFREWGPRWAKLGRGIDRVARGFERHTALYLIVNRFLPGVRAFFFVAAGFARVPVWKLLVFGLLSSVAWNFLLVGAGYMVGANLEVLFQWLRRYTWAVWVILAIVGVVLLLRFYPRRTTGCSP